jgi:hypothetical protein
MSSVDINKDALVLYLNDENFLIERMSEKYCDFCDKTASSVKHIVCRSCGVNLMVCAKHEGSNCIICGNSIS